MSETPNKAAQPHEISVCVSTGCASRGSEAILTALQHGLAARESGDQCRLRGCGCLRLCSSGPMMSVDDNLYQHVTADDVDDILHNLGGPPVKELECDKDMPFFTKQCRVVLENAGRIDPESIDDYVGVGGYSALGRAVREMNPEDVLREVKKSGLRGRGGAGYPTGLKWETVAKASASKKYIICNGDEGDPGAFMDRSIMEDDPHRVLEGMAIAGYAVGADHGYLYVRAEYPLSIKRLRRAINQAKRAGYLGHNVCGTSFNFSVDIRLGAGAFVCGEETALIESIQGGRGTPRPRPPYPAMSGLWGSPTLINNAETFANISSIVRNGWEWYASIGTENAKGTKVFALTGRINNSGLIEVPMGITLREIIFEIGGGIPGGKRFKAVQTGGPSGGCIPEAYLDEPVEYESLGRLGSIMGSGGMIVMDETSNMVDVARYFMEFSKTESCGKCVPCRAGTVQMYDLLTRFVNKDATQADLEQLEHLCDVVRNTSLCGLGVAAPNPVLSTLRYFREEYLECIREPETAGVSGGGEAS